ncbi:YgeY family selenium metabolism-linked hydrolase [uncultured Sphaerochaeta sp.]|uniref:YgeY family selenium metabolism-linked hydrolase n=1 Tax=uncultured Sphaerochaeta sp. TaxID=886478 RepID=UPI002A0A65C6|nr:YgeY family selenium metabolism-linked hydrolase [uncultured Sphaerochaeta sp.]
MSNAMRPIIADELIALCTDMVKESSISGTEKGVVEVVGRWMKQLGFDEVSTDKYGSVIGKIQGTGGGPTVVLDGHVDTVEVGDPSLWTHDPFGAEIVDGKMYGRGTSDMKGALSAMIYAASRFTENRLSGDIYVTGTVHEEMFEGIALNHILDRVPADYVVIGEASSLNLKIGQRGRAEIVVKTHGKSCHSANPQFGKNAVYLMQKALSDIAALKLPSDNHLGSGIMELTDIISEPYPGASVVPSACMVTFDRRLIEGETAEQVVAQIRGAITSLTDDECEVFISEGNAICHTGVEISAKRFFPAWYYTEQTDFIQKVHQGLHETGIPAQFQTYSFCTNGSASAGLRGIPTLGFGPSAENQAHVCDEYIEIAQLIQASKGYCAIVTSLMR